MSDKVISSRDNFALCHKDLTITDAGRSFMQQERAQNLETCHALCPLTFGLAYESLILLVVRTATIKAK